MQSASYQVADESWIIRLGPQVTLWQRDVSFNSTSGSVNSEIIGGVYFDALIPISKRWNLEHSLEYRRISFNDSASRTFNADSKSFIKISSGINRRFERLSLGLGLNFETSPFIIESSSTTVTSETFSIFSPYIKSEYSLEVYKKTKLTFGFMTRYLLGSEGATRSFEGGFAGRLYLDATRLLKKNSQLSIVPFIEFQDSQTTLVGHQDLEFGMRVLYGFIF